MKKSAIVVLALVPFVLGFPSALPACSFSPELFGLSVRAEAILLVRIEGVDNSTPLPQGEWVENADHFEENSVTLRVLETWKGPAMTEVRMEVFDASPYRVGDVMLAFLKSGETRTAATEDWLDEWVPENPEELALRAKAREENRRFAAWSAGRWFSAGNAPSSIAFPREQDRAVIKDLLLAAIRLQSSGTIDPPDLRDWFVSAAEHRVTRSEGLSRLQWELVPATYRLVDADSEEAEEEPMDASETEVEDAVESAPEPLTKDQLARLAAGFARDPAVDASDATMLRLLADYPDLEVDRTAASLVEAGLQLRPIPSWVTEIVELALARYGDVFADRIGRDDIDKEGRPIYTGEGENTLPTIWEVARRELGIPSVAAAVAPE
jgi:hypothetical protein